MSDVKSILLSGVGGQGTILVSKILTQGLVQKGYDVKMSEIHGMAQRGGSVSTQVRYGSEVNSPIIGLGEADILVAFEKMEAVRYAEYLKPDGVAVINNYEIVPLPVAAGRVDYPEGLLEAMQAKFNVHAFDAMEVAAQVGNIRTMNVVLFGAMVGAFPDLQDIDWEQVVADTVPEKFREVNVKAFRAGRKMIEER
ncbi:MAG: indolepyruvate oxidoreductase subunit beta [Eubacteriales bacterium]|nr:indolepyruvate oxidoreductase subunit beta [Eubacteriales bacterium]